MLFAAPESVPPPVERKMLLPAVMPATTSSGLNELIVTLPPGLVTCWVKVAPPCALRTMLPAVVLCSALIVAAAGADALRSIAMPFAAFAKRFGVFTATETDGDPIAPFEEVSVAVVPCTLPGPTRSPADARVTAPAPALTGPARVIEPEAV